MFARVAVGNRRKLKKQSKKPQNIGKLPNSMEDPVQAECHETVVPPI